MFLLCWSLYRRGHPGNKPLNSRLLLGYFWFLTVPPPVSSPWPCCHTLTDACWWCSFVWCPGPGSSPATDRAWVENGRREWIDFWWSPVSSSEQERGEPGRSINQSVVLVDRDNMLYGFRRSILCLILLSCTGVWILHIFCHALTMTVYRTIIFRGLLVDSGTLNGFILLLRDHVVINFSYHFLNGHMIHLQTLSRKGNEMQRPICMKHVLLSRVCFVPLLT